MLVYVTDTLIGGNYGADLFTTYEQYNLINVTDKLTLGMDQEIKVGPIWSVWLGLSLDNIAAHGKYSVRIINIFYYINRGQPIVHLARCVI